MFRYLSLAAVIGSSTVASAPITPTPESSSIEIYSRDKQHRSYEELTTSKEWGIANFYKTMRVCFQNKTQRYMLVNIGLRYDTTTENNVGHANLIIVDNFEKFGYRHIEEVLKM